MQIVLYRNDIDWDNEKDVVSKYFITTPRRNSQDIKAGTLVIPRFSALPFFKELEDDIKYVGASLINSYNEHLYVADMINWVGDLADITPKTWMDPVYIPDKPLVLKGETNSKKFLWNSHMFANNKKEALDIYGKLTQDSLLQYQKIFIREYVPLKTYMVGLQGLPITKEFRFFYYRKTKLSGAYYWASHIEELKEIGICPDVSEVPEEFLKKVASIVAPNIPFWVVDIAQTQSGEWIVIELNDATMSGLSCNDPNPLWKNLKQEINK